MALAGEQSRLEDAFGDDGEALRRPGETILAAPAELPELAPDQVCLAMAASRTSPLVHDFFAAAQATADITAECGNYEARTAGPAVDQLS